MRRFIPDLVFITLAAAIALLMAGRPPQALHQAPAPAIEVEQASAQSAPKRELSGQPKKMEEGAEAGKRNIFSATGSYKEEGAAANAVMPENPYELIGIVREGETKALFREYTGTVIKAGKGHKMRDGFVIKTIEAQRVITWRGEEKKEFVLFSAATPAVAGKGKVRNLSDQSPVLIGIIGGKVKKAVFRDQAGDVILMDARRTLPDGSVITRIDPQAVVVKKQGESKELKPRSTGLPLPPVQRVQEVASGQTAATTAVEKVDPYAPLVPRPSASRPRPAPRNDNSPVKAAPEGI